MDTNKMRDPVREQFEAFWLKSVYHQGLGESSLVRVWMDDPQSEYAIERTQYLWALWQASREAVVIDLTSAMIPGGGYLEDQDAIAAIEAQGLRVAP